MTRKTLICWFLFFYTNENPYMQILNFAAISLFQFSPSRLLTADRNWQMSTVLHVSIGSLRLTLQTSLWAIDTHCRFIKFAYTIMKLRFFQKDASPSTLLLTSVSSLCSTYFHIVRGLLIQVSRKPLFGSRLNFMGRSLSSTSPDHFSRFFISGNFSILRYLQFVSFSLTWGRMGAKQ